MTIQETTDTLNRLSPDELQGWLPYCHQVYVQVATLEVRVPVDKQELDGLSDNKIKELIHNRTISVHKDKLSTLTLEENEYGL